MTGSTAKHSGKRTCTTALLCVALLAYALALGTVVLLLTAAPIEGAAALALAYSLVFTLAAAGIAVIFKRFVERR